MKISVIFTLLSWVGCWRPILWSSPLKTLIYNIYILFVILLSIAFVASEVGSLFNVDNVDEFVDNTYMLVSIFAGCGKLANMLVHRKDIINVMNVFTEEPCATSNIEEKQIQMKFNDQVRRNTLRYTMMIEASVCMTIFNSLLTNFQQSRLTYRAWIPYDYTSTIAFSLTFALQLLCVVIMSLIHVATDVLFFGLLTQICCQFEILLSRLNDITRNSKAILQRYVRHHDCIYRLAGMVNESLDLLIFSQLFGSFLALCLSMILLLKADILSTEFLAAIFYLATIMLQSFLYCWYGNEVKLKSIDLADVMFELEWTGLDKDAKKTLLIAMNRTRSPIELESMHVITVNINFFMVLVKSSYSVYNVLQNSRK